MQRKEKQVIYLYVKLNILLLFYFEFDCDLVNGVRYTVDVNLIKVL